MEFGRNIHININNSVGKGTEGDSNENTTYYSGIKSLNTDFLRVQCTYRRPNRLKIN